MPLTRRLRLSWIALAFVIGLGPLAAVAETTTPNMVFIFTDDLGFGDLSCYGHPYARTPALDKLAAEGTRFTQAYVTGVTCCPSRTGFMTGVWPARYQQYPAGYGFGDRATITELLNKRGYKTGHFGKWHIGPNAASGVYGIDEYKGGGGHGDDARGRDAHHFDDAIAFIKKHKSGPFYVNLWGHATHYPVNTHPELVKVFADVKVDRKDFSSEMQHKFDECESIGGKLDGSMHQYLGDVYSVDMGVERIMKTLDDLGLRENTIVVFSSDHGPAPVLLGADKNHREFSKNMLGYAGVHRGGKHSEYEGGVRVPFIVRWPGKIPAGRVDESSVISGIDWLPTLCALAGVEGVPSDLDGQDVSAAWFGKGFVRQKPLYWRVSSPGGTPAMRQGDWKLHLNRRTGPELYDLSTDPAERRNLVKDKTEVAADLTVKLKSWVATLPKAYEKTEKKPKRKDKKRKKAKR